MFRVHSDRLSRALHSARARSKSANQIVLRDHQLSFSPGPSSIRARMPCRHFTDSRGAFELLANPAQPSIPGSHPFRSIPLGMQSLQEHRHVLQFAQVRHAPLCERFFILHLSAPQPEHSTNLRLSHGPTTESCLFVAAASVSTSLPLGLLAHVVQHRRAASCPCCRHSTC